MMARWRMFAPLLLPLPRALPSLLPLLWSHLLTVLLGVLSTSLTLFLRALLRRLSTLPNWLLRRLLFLRFRNRVNDFGFGIPGDGAVCPDKQATLLDALHQLVSVFVVDLIVDGDSG